MFGSSESVGLFIDSKSIFVAHILMQGKTAKIIGSAEAVRPDLPSDEDTLKKTAEAIGGAFVQARATAVKNVYLAIPAEGSMIRSFELPVLPKKELKTAVKFEARKYVPFDLKDLYYDFETFVNSSKKRMSVVFFAAKKSFVDGMVDLLRGAHVEIKGIELSSHASIRSFNYETSHHSDEVYAVIQAGDERTAEIIIARKQAVLVTRHVAFTKLPDMVGGMDLAPFASEIRLSFDYFSENFKNEKISKLFIRSSGNRDTLNRLHETLRQEFTLPIEIANTPMAMTDKPRSPGMNIAFGLALRGVWDTRTKQIDLSPPKQTEAVTTLSATELPWEEEKKMLMDFAIREIFVLVGIMVVAFFYLSNQLGVKRAELNQQASAYAKPQTVDVAAPLTDLTAKQSSFNTRMTYLNQVIDKRSYVTLKLNALVRAVPPEIRLTRMDFEEALGPNGLMPMTLHIEGAVFSGDVISSVNKLATALKNNKEFMQGFEDVKTRSISSLNKTFSLDCVGARRS